MILYLEKRVLNKKNDNKKFVIKNLTHNNENIILIKSFLSQINSDFPIPLTEKIDFDDYLHKVFRNGEVFVALENNRIVGLLTGYLNDSLNRKGYIC